MAEYILTYWGEIIAAILAVLLGVVVAIATYYIRVRRGNYVLVRRLSQTPQINISDRVKQTLDVRYKGQPVDNIVLNTFEVINNSVTDIKPFEITLGVQPLSDKNKFIELESQDPLNILNVKQDDPTTYTLSREYLNSNKRYKDEKLAITIFSNTRLDFYVTGGGAGWGVRYEELHDKISRSYFVVITTMYITFLVFIAFWAIRSEADTLTKIIETLAIAFMICLLLLGLLPNVESRSRMLIYRMKRDIGSIR